MAVLVEAGSVIVRRDAIDWGLSGGWDAFLEIVPNGTLCTDRRLARVGFTDPAEMGRFIERLEEAGLLISREGRFVDVAVIDLARGLALPCDWLQFGRVPDVDGTEVAYCQLSLPGFAPPPIQTLEQVAVHEDWTTRSNRGMALHLHSPEVSAPGPHTTSSPPLQRGRSL